MNFTRAPTPIAMISKMSLPWQQTVQQKRARRDEAIQRVLPLQDTENPPAEAARDPTSIDNVDGILRAIQSKAVTAKRLCTAYIRR